MTDQTNPTAAAIIEAPTKAKPAKAKKAAPAKGKKAKGKAAPKGKAKGKAFLAAGKAVVEKQVKARAESKQAGFIAAMRTAKGISIAEAAERFGWQKHTVRGAVAGALRKKLGLKVEAERDEKRGTVYRIK